MEAITSLKADGRAVMFLSNKPIATRKSYADKLTALGIPTTEDEVLNSSQGLAYWMRQEMPDARAYIIGEQPVLDDLAAAGIISVTDPLEAEVVVVSWDRNFSYNQMNDALQALTAGARLVATNPDVSCPVDGGLFVPDCGAMVAAIEACSGQQVEIYGGKPSPIMGELALARIGLSVKDCLMVGDRVHTDILFGYNAGMSTALVLTGAGRLIPLSEAPAAPDFILQSVADLRLS